MITIDCVNFAFHHARGPIYGYLTAKGLRALMLPGPARKRVHWLPSAAGVVLGKKLQDELQRYFAGISVNFADIPLDLPQTTPFRRRVWMATRRIPWGETASYGDIAKRVSRVSASARAVGGALGTNPIPILIPCHRILPAAGGLGGFSAGIDWKRELLRIEGHAFP